LNLRYPGQYYDAETGLHYNYFRDYDAKSGRYVESDPVGLNGGVNSFEYTLSNPMKSVDRYGLDSGMYYANPPYQMAVPSMPPLRPCSCPIIPPSPPGVSCAYNIREAQQHYNPTWFYDQVRNKGPWDYKQLDPQYEDFGNFNYGATGYAFGFSHEILLRGAGWAQQRAGTNVNNQNGYWYGRAPFGDDSRDQTQIANGIDYYRCNCYKSP
jgi:RHS repeat-associated protein